MILRGISIINVDRMWVVEAGNHYILAGFRRKTFQNVSGRAFCRTLFEVPEGH